MDTTPYWPWPATAYLTADELASYLAAAADPASQHLATRCTPWTVRDLSAHLAITFRRFAEGLERSRSGDLSPPFERAALAEQNLRAVAAFAGDARLELAKQARRFLALVDDPGEMMAHQFGPIPVGLQVAFALNELAIHHEDLAAARGDRYRPPEAAIAVLVPVWERSLGGLPDADDAWQRILVASGRTVSRAEPREPALTDLSPRGGSDRNNSAHRPTCAPTSCAR